MKTPITITELDGRQLINVPEEIKSKLSTFGYSYLQSQGYWNDNPIDQDGYIPWYTYPAISFLKDIISPDMKVLEYGSGYSTLFYKDKVKELTTVEHDANWAQKIIDINNTIDIYVVGENAVPHPSAMNMINQFVRDFPQIRTSEHTHDYVHGLINNEFAGYASIIYDKPKGYYDIVVLDGMARALTAYLAADMGSDTGYIILDNSDRWHYNFIQQHLFDEGFGRIDFWGPGYGLYDKWCTSFFSKNFKVKNNKKVRESDNGLIKI